jgi:methylthioribose-1-phosphate isomerase
VVPQHKLRVERRFANGFIYCWATLVEAHGGDFYATALDPTPYRTISGMIALITFR